MREIYSVLNRWSKESQPVALATVIKTWGSAPRSIGAKMAVNEAGEIIGSVSGGCVEGAVVSACLEVIETGKPRLLHFDVADETALNVGLSCGGELDILVGVLSPEFLEAFNDADASEKVLTQVTFISGDHFGEAFILDQDSSYPGDGSDINTREILDMTLNQTQTLQLSTGETIFVDVIKPPPKLIIVGGVHTAVALTKIAKASGYTVILVDPRRQFGTKVRFPEADQIINLWPDDAFQNISLTSSTAIAFLTHDPKIDDPGLMSALRSDAFYIGALGSRKTQKARNLRLLESGMPEHLISRISGPIGLPLGGREPEEIAIAIMAEIIQVRNNK